MIKLIYSDQRYVTRSAYCPAYSRAEELFTIEVIKDGEVSLWTASIPLALNKGGPVSEAKNLRDYQLDLTFRTVINGKYNYDWGSEKLLVRIIYPAFSWIYVFGYKKLETPKRKDVYAVGVYYHLNRTQTLPQGCLVPDNSGVFCSYEMAIKGNHHLLVSEQEWRVWFGDWQSQSVQSIQLIQCFIFTDCFGCKYLSPLYLKDGFCSWSSNHCYPADAEFPQSCLNITAVSIDELTIGRTAPVEIKITGFNLANNYGVPRLEIDQAPIETSHSNADILVFDTKEVRYSNESRMLVLNLSVAIVGPGFESSVESDSRNLPVFLPKVLQISPNFAIEGHAMVLNAIFNGDIKSLYTRLEVKVENVQCTAASKAWDASGHVYTCIFHEPINRSAPLIFIFGSYELAHSFEVKPRPVCQRVEPKAFIHDASHLDFAVYGFYLNNTYNGGLFARLGRHSPELTVDCATWLHDRIECKIKNLPEFNAGRIRVGLQTHGFMLDRFCPITEVIQVYAKPVFYEAEYDSKNQVVHFKAAHYIVIFPLCIKLQSTDSRLISLCALLPERSKGKKHQCMVNTSLNLENKIKALAYIAGTEYDMGFVDFLGAAEGRRQIKNIVVGASSVVIVAMIILVCYAWYYHYVRRHSLKPHIKRLAALRLFIQRSRFVPNRMRTRTGERSEARTFHIPEPPSISMAGGSSDLSCYFAGTKTPVGQVPRVTYAKKVDFAHDLTRQGN